MPVTSIELSQTSISLKSNKNVTLKATVKPSIATEKTVRWASRNTDIVQIDPTTGEMKAVGNGSAVIVAIATDGTNKFASCTVEATVLVSEIVFTYNTINVIGGNQTWFIYCGKKHLCFKMKVYFISINGGNKRWPEKK